MFKPAYKLTLGSTTLDSVAAPTQSTLVALDVSLDLDTPADQAVIRLGRVDGPHPAVGDDVSVELGYADDGMHRVFTGTVADVRPDITATRVTALSPMRELMALRVEQTYQNKTAGEIARDLAGQAGVSVDTVEDGVSFLAYVADGGRNAYQHIRALADKSGLDVYVTPEGKLVFRRFAGTVTTHVFEYGQHIIELVVQAAPATAAQVQVFGESPADAQGDGAFAWLTKSFNPGTAGSGAPTLLVQDPSLRTGTAANTAAQAAAQRLKQRTLTGQLRALGRAPVKLGDAVRVTGAPDDCMNETFQVRGVHHRLTKGAGFTTRITFWSLGSDGP
jgi:phage protein D